jgi:hypothetical protein
VFRGIRLLRVFKLARTWKNFQNILMKIGKTLKDIRNFSVLLFLFIFTYTLLGMELFAFKVKYNSENLVDENGEAPRANFDSFLNGITSVFIILIGEDWNNVMYAHVRSEGIAVSVFFLSLVILGNFILLNLFLAILLKNFEEDDHDREETDDASMFRKVLKYLKEFFYFIF